MKKLAAYLFVLAVGIVIGRLGEQPRTRAEGETSGPATDERFCADADGDGNLTITDAIVILNFLFRGSGVPYCVEQGLGIGDVPPRQDVEIDWVTIDRPNNSADDTGLGSVADTYRISSYEITNLQWAAFLNCVDPNAENPHGLFEACEAEFHVQGLLLVEGNAPGSRYVVTEGLSELPITCVDWFDCARFCNWLHNGQGDGDTEDGAYDMSMDPAEIVRKPEAGFFLPTENEWYKAAYYEPRTRRYFDYPTSSDILPCTGPPRGEPNASNCASSSSTAVGAYVESPSPFGTYDQCCNVGEWIEDVHITGNRRLRGSSWGSFPDGCLSSSPRGQGNPSNRSEFVGFRPASRLP